MRRLGLEVVSILVILVASPHGCDEALNELLYASWCFNIGVKERHRWHAGSRLIFDKDSKKEGVGNAQCSC